MSTMRAQSLQADAGVNSSSEHKQQDDTPPEGVLAYKDEVEIEDGKKISLEDEELNYLPVEQKEVIAKQVDPYKFIPQLNIRTEHARYIVTAVRNAMQLLRRVVDLIVTLLSSCIASSILLVLLFVTLLFLLLAGCTDAENTNRLAGKRPAPCVAICVFAYYRDNSFQTHGHGTLSPVLSNKCYT